MEAKRPSPTLPPISNSITMPSFDSPLSFPCGARMPNRFALAPMTNTQSHEDGRLSDDEYRWLTMRAQGGFGMVMTCASHVQAVGQGFPGQLGIFSDLHTEGHRHLAAGIQAHGSLALVQLHHAGMRSPEALIGTQPVCSSAVEEGKIKARGLSAEEVQALIRDFIAAALRAKSAGYDGVEVHGAHGYILTQFLSAQYNKRTDAYGGPFENRSRIVVEILDGIREACGPDFLLGLRLSPERFGMDLDEVKAFCLQLDADQRVDFLDISLWDYRKTAEAESASQSQSSAENDAADDTEAPQTLLDQFRELDFGYAKWTVAGKIHNGQDVADVLDADVDFVSIGRSGILHHDFPQRAMADPGFKATEPPVSEAYLQAEGLGPAFVRYMSRWPDFVAKADAKA